MKIKDRDHLNSRDKALDERAKEGWRIVLDAKEGGSGPSGEPASWFRD